MNTTIRNAFALFCDEQRIIKKNMDRLIFNVY